MDYILWKPVVGHEGYYEVSNTGLVRGVRRILVKSDGKRCIIKEKLLLFKFDKDGYTEVTLSKENKLSYCRVHRLVAIAFIPNPENKPIPNHLNGIKHDNRVDNLEWSTESENQLHSFRVLGQEACNKKKINQYTHDGKFLNQFESIAAASKSINCARMGIRKAAQGKWKMWRGYIWKYAS